jgi:transcriptional regulator with XRE-family HTH domain
MAKRIIVTAKPEQKDCLNEKLLGQWVRFVRTSVGLSIEDAAALAGVSKQAFSDLEYGKVGCRLGIMMKILDSLGIKLGAEIPVISAIDARDE